MTNDKFVQWLSGFCAAVEGTPTQKQWDIILKVLKEISEDKGISNINDTFMKPLQDHQIYRGRHPSVWPNQNGGIMQATPYISPEDKKVLFNTIISDKNITTK
jgi:hypothetical protein